VPKENKKNDFTDTGSVCFADLSGEAKQIAKRPGSIVHNFTEIILYDCYPERRKPKKHLFDCPNFYAEGTAPFNVLSSLINSIIS
jgi:hypothetical protein